MASSDMKQAKANKKDEFYTTLEDIELEMKNYREYIHRYCICITYVYTFFFALIKVLFDIPVIFTTSA